MKASEANPDLMRIFDFTVADLEANRAGHMSERQMMNLSYIVKRRRLELILLGIVFPILFLAVYFERFLQTLSQGIEVWEIALVFWVIIWLIAGFVSSKRFASDIKSGIVYSVQGTMKRWEGHGSSGTLEIANEWLEIDGRQNTFLKGYLRQIAKGTQFRIYYAPKTEKILSMEKIDS